LGAHERRPHECRLGERALASSATIRIGTSGWSYPNWRGPFYPAGLPAGEWLGFYARQFSTVEVNATFYRLPAPATVARWCAATPPHFLFSVKAWRALTHEHRLTDCAAQLAMFLERIAGFGERLGPILFQLPPRFPVDLDRLARFLDRLPPGCRCAFEFRDPSWWCDAVASLLARRNAAFVAFDLAGLASPRLSTGEQTYVRLHGHARRYRAPYPPSVLADWAAWLSAERAAGNDVLAYLDNTMDADDAPRDARRLAALLTP
jgi:uncharacterized protein YecE (DUF72 family)